MKKIFFVICVWLISLQTNVYSQWEQIYGFNGTHILNITISDSVLYLGTWSGGMFKSTNYGEKWEAINNGFHSRFGPYINSSLSKGPYLFVSADDKGFRSSNGGDSWELLSQLNEGNDIRCFATTGENLYALLYNNGLYVSTNNGNNWTHLPSFMDSIYTNSLANFGYNLFATTSEKGIYRSMDGGLNWNPINIGISENYTSNILSIDSNMFITTTNKVYKSSNLGDTWDLVFSLAPNRFIESIINIEDTIYVSCLGSLFKVNISTGDWVDITSFLPDISINCFAVSDNIIYAGTNGQGFYKSTNFGQSWESRNNGLTGDSVNAVKPVGNNIVAGTNKGTLLSDNGGSSWIENYPELPNSAVNTFLEYNSKIFAGTDNGVDISTNYGSTWTKTNNEISNNKVYCLMHMENSLLAGTNNGFYSSTNGGESWVNTNNGLANTDIRALTNDGTNIFAGTKGGGIYRSEDNGLNWVTVNNGIDNKEIRSLTYFNNNLYAGSEGLYRSTNNGDYWERVGPYGNWLLPSAFVEYNSMLFSSTLFNYLVYTVDGINWQQVYPYFSEYGNFLAINDDYLFAGSSTGIFRTPLNTLFVDVKVENNKHPLSFSLQQNYPNPFNPTTTINYSISEQQLVNLTVYNVLGEKVEELVNKEQSSGNYTVNFNANNLSSGVYFYTLRAGDLLSTKKMVLLR